jgi:hypothetical protein
MAEWLRDPIWQFVGAVIGLLFGFAALVEAGVIYYLQQKTKEFAFDISAHIPLVAAQTEVEGRLDVRLDGKSVQNAWLTIVTLHNAGNVPIVPSDFVQPVQIDLGENAKIINVLVANQRPQDLGASADFESGITTLKPVLFNPKDRCTLHVYAADADNAPRVNGRIVGVPRIEKRPVERGIQVARPNPLTIVILVALVISALVLQSLFLWGFVTAGLVGFVLQQTLFLLARRQRF